MPFSSPSPRHARAPGYSIGRRMPSPSRDPGPGPGEYDPFVRAPLRAGPAAAIVGRPTETAAEAGPGPADYITSPGQP